MRPFLFTALLFLLGGSTYCQELTEFAVTYDNDTIALQGPFDPNIPRRYYSADGKRRKLPHGTIKEIYHGSTHFLDLPFSAAGLKEMQRVVMMNDKYLLASLSTGPTTYRFNLFDRRTNEAVALMVRHSLTYKEDLRNYEEYLVPYFGDCTEILQIIKNSIGKEQYAKIVLAGDKMFRTVSNFDCEKLRE